MTAAVVLARLLLVLVFAAAGAAKLVDREGTRTALHAFGLRRPADAAAAIVLPVAELAVAAALLLPGVWRWGAAGAFLLLLVFSVGIANSLLHGRRPACHCFGQLSASPTSWKTVGRNAVLAAVAATVALAGRGQEESAAATTLLLVVLGCLVAGLTLLVLSRRAPSLSLTRLEEWSTNRPRLRAPVVAAARLARAIAPTGAPPSGLPIGSRAPDFRGRDPEGTVITLDSLLGRGVPALLIFVDDGCKPCSELKPAIVRWQNELRDRLAVAPIAGDPPDDAPGSGDARRRREVAEAYDADVMPSAVVVGPDGRIASHLAIGEASIRELVESVAER